MDVQRLAAGQVIDGFTLEQPLAPGGMASFWRVGKPGADMPMLMKIPLMRRGEDPITIVGFEARISRDTLEDLGRACRQEAIAITARLGGRPEPAKR